MEMAGSDRHGARAFHDGSHRPIDLNGIMVASNVIHWSGMARFRRDNSVFIHPPHTTARPGGRMNEGIQVISELDRIIHEPGRLMIIALLAAVKECDFLYLLQETEMNKGNLSSHLVRLEEAGYVEIQKTYRGKVPQTLLRLTRSGRGAFDEYRKGLKAFLSSHESE